MDRQDAAAAPALEQSLTRPNWRRAGVKLIPYVGDALDELVFGRMDEARWKRLERTLDELGQMMKEHHVPPTEVTKEDFGRLLEVVGPAVSRTTSEQKRLLLRALLFNGVRLPEGDARWESARLAASLISDLEAPALAILAALDSLGARGETRAELRATSDQRGAEVTRTDGGIDSVSLAYDWLVVEQGYRKLSAAPTQLVVAGAHGHDKYERIALTVLGGFVIEWASAKAGEASPNVPSSPRMEPTRR